MDDDQKLQNVNSFLHVMGPEKRMGLFPCEYASTHEGPKLQGTSQVPEEEIRKSAAIPPDVKLRLKARFGSSSTTKQRKPERGGKLIPDPFIPGISSVSLYPYFPDSTSPTILESMRAEPVDGSNSNQPQAYETYTSDEIIKVMGFPPWVTPPAFFRLMGYQTPTSGLSQTPSISSSSTTLSSVPFCPDPIFGDEMAAYSSRPIADPSKTFTIDEVMRALGFPRGTDVKSFKELIAFLPAPDTPEP